MNPFPVGIQSGPPARELSGILSELESPMTRIIDQIDVIGFRHDMEPPDCRACPTIGRLDSCNACSGPTTPDLPNWATVEVSESAPLEVWPRAVATHCWHGRLVIMSVIVFCGFLLWGLRGVM